MSNDSQKRIKILFLAANPMDMARLQLDEEVRAIDEQLQAAQLRDRFELESHWAVRVEDLHELFIRHNPTVVHFSGHGNPKGEIVLLDEGGRGVPVDADALANLFAIFHPRVRCTVLNACYTAQQAEAVAPHVECVVGTSAPITDDDATDFAAGFYLGLASGFSVQKAFDLGRNRIELGGSDADEALHLRCLDGDPTQIVLAARQAEASTAEEAARKAAYAAKAEQFPPHTPIRRGCYASAGRISVSVVLSALFVAVVGGWLWNSWNATPALDQPVALPQATGIVEDVAAGDVPEPAVAAVEQADAALAAGDYATAAQTLEEAAQAAQEANAPQAAATLLLRQGDAHAAEGDLAAAVEAYQSALTAARRAGDSTAAQRAQAALGNLALQQGDTETARARYQAALTLARENGDAHAVGVLLINLGMAELAAGDNATAQGHLDEASAVLETVEIDASLRREIRSLQRALE